MNVAGIGLDPNELIQDSDNRAKQEGGERSKLPAATRGPGRRMSDDDFQGLVYVWATDARNYVEEFVAEDRYNSTEYYKGRLPDVDAETVEEDRSRAVLTEVRDTVLGMMPDLLRIFFGTESVIKFDAVPCADPQLAEQKDQEAQQATDYIHQVVLKGDNPDFFQTMHDIFQDALVRRTGFVTWRWEKTKRPEYSTHTGLTEDMAMALAADDTVEILGKRAYLEDIGDGMGPVPLYDLQIRRTLEQGRLRIRGVPCENCIVARRGTAIDKTSLFGFTEDKSVGDFLAEGWIDDPAELADCDKDPTDDDNWETQARRPEVSTMVGPADDPPEDPTQRKVKYGELYITADRDGDGIPELIRVITGGIRYKILHEEPVDDIDFAAFCPYPEAYQFFGESVADLTMDIQRIKSRILRDTLDSLAQSVQPQTAVVEGQVNLDDVLNCDTSKIVRMRAPGMVQPLTVPFVGKDGLPVLEFMTQVRENRTGQSDASNGLDPGALQSSTQSAVHATLTKAQSRVEMVARIFAETGFKRMFRGMLRTTIKNVDLPRLVRLNKRVVQIDPRQWDAEMDATVTLAFGQGSQQQQLAALGMILGKQQELLMMLGPQNPIVSLDQFCYTLKKMVEIAGWHNTTSFFGDFAQLDPQAKQQAIAQIAQTVAQHAAASKGGPNPQIEQAKIASNERIEQQKMQLAALKMHAEWQMEMMKLRGNLELEAMRIAADRKTALDEAGLSALVEHAGARLDARVQHHANMMGEQTKLAIARMQPQQPAGDDGE